MTADTTARHRPELRRRAEAALKTLYPKLLARAHRLVGSGAGGAFDANDLRQDGVMAAYLCVHNFSDDRLDELDDKALASILFAIASKAVNGRDRGPDTSRGTGAPAAGASPARRTRRTGASNRGWMRVTR